MANKETTPDLSSLASRVLRATRDGLDDPELDLTWLLNSARRLAGSVLGQDETVGNLVQGRRTAKPSVLVPELGPDNQMIIGGGEVRPVLQDRSAEWWDGYWRGMWDRSRR